MKKQILLLIISIIATYAFANIDIELSKAFESYQAHDYQHALESFLKLSNEGYENSELFYNIGNCYYRVGELGNSILFMKKSLKLDSTNKKAARNLTFLLTQTKDKQIITEQDSLFKFFSNIFATISLNSLAIASLIIIAFIILLIHIVIHQAAGKERTIPYFMITILSVFLIIIAIFSSIKINILHNNNSAVLLADTAIGYSGPNTEFIRVFTIHEGMIFEIEKEQDGWALVKLSNGVGGWIINNSFAKVKIK